jgi:hypothetical protein
MLTGQADRSLCTMIDRLDVAVLQMRESRGGELMREARRRERTRLCPLQWVEIAALLRPWHALQRGRDGLLRFTLGLTTAGPTVDTLRIGLPIAP